METTAPNTTGEGLPFSRPTIERLRKVDEADLLRALDDTEADRELAHAMDYLERRQPDATHARPYPEIRKELKEEGLL